MIKAQNITKTYTSGEITNTVLHGIDLTIKTGEFVAIMGRSGAGKSTLLYQLGLLDHPTTGSILIDGIETEKLTNTERTVFRLQKLGYVFQEYALLPELTALENVLVPLMMQGMEIPEATEKAKVSLERVGMGDRLRNLPSQLSGGEQQRVSIARAIAHDPTILFADEPTANLDSDNAKTIIDLFLKLHKQGQTIVMVTHEPEYGAMTDRVLQVKDGRIAA